MIQPISGQEIEPFLLDQDCWVLEGVVYRKWRQRITPGEPFVQDLQPEVDRYADLWYRILNLSQEAFNLSHQGYLHAAHWFLECWLEGDLFSRFTGTEAKEEFVERLHHQNQLLGQFKNPFPGDRSPHTRRLIGTALKWKPWLVKPYKTLIQERKALVQYLRFHDPLLFQVTHFDVSSSGQGQGGRQRFKRLR
jgi:hypothetical protein